MLASLRDQTIALLCIAYLLGLLLWATPWQLVLGISVGLGLAFLRSPPAQRFFRQHAIPVPRQWWSSPGTRWWVMATLMMGLAGLYLWISQPYPAVTDVSRWVPTQSPAIAAQVTGTVQSRPALTRRGTRQFWLTVQRVAQSDQIDQSDQFDQSKAPATGKLYVTLPNKAAKDLRPNQTVTLSGTLYRPQKASQPGGFDFAQYLAQEGAFAGLKGKRVRLEAMGSAWGGWAIRDRIRAAIQRGTDAKTGALLSALVLGKTAADIPFDLKDAFIRAGLAHALAASGFQVALILGVTLAAGRSLPVGGQIGLSGGALLLYGLLSGAEPSIVRAILMGCASLVGVGLQKAVRPIPTLLIIAVVMLLYKPLWIWDLGFQLSFLATLGLMVTATPLAKALDWLPPAIAEAVAVPLAATLWTLPLQLYTFGVLPLYGLLANVITAPLLTGLTIGGFLCSLAALLWPLLGSGIAWLLFWPTQLLIFIVEGVSQLPGNALALGSISLLQLLLLYACILAVWLLPQGRQYWKLAAAVSFLLIVIPVWQVQTQRFMVTVFDQTRMPLLTLQHPQGTVVLNSGDRLTARQSLVPFLQREGIQRIDWAIDTQATPSTQSGWLAILQQMPIQVLSRTVPQAIDLSTELRPQKQIELNPQEQLSLGFAELRLWRAQPTILTLRIDTQTWLLVDGSNETDFAAWFTTAQMPPTQVLWWTGGSLSPQLVESLHPQTLILSGQKMAKEAIATLKQRVPQVFWLERDGTLQWTPQGFRTTLNPGENTLSPLG